MSCNFTGCARGAKWRGYCETHYKRMWANKALPPRPTTEQRFDAKVNVTETCWLWVGGTDVGGYGVFALEHTKSVKAHRYSYERRVGPIPDGLFLDHLCRVRNCVNPEHLEPVTTRENLLRGEGFQAKNAAKTHCHKNHPFDTANTYRNRGRRICRACQSERRSARRAA